MPHPSFSQNLLRFLIIVGFGLIGAVLAEAGAPTQDSTPQTPESCASCHVDIVAMWQEGTHANAFSDPVFQETWQEQGGDAECLACHTTGYVPRTGEYAHEGVTCEACHGQTPADHPAEPVALDPGVETCAECHATTVNEWEQSKHGEQQLACTTCHNPHPQELRFETAEALCLNCHSEDARDDYAHLVHASQSCVDCHWHHAETEDLLAHYESGALFPTGHEANVETRACVDCHSAITETDVMEEGSAAEEEMGLVSEHPLLEARVRIEELEAEVETVKSQGQNTSALRLAQGLIIGLAVGAIVVFGVANFRRRNARIVEEHQEE